MSDIEPLIVTEKVSRIRVILILTVRSTIHHTGMLSGDVTRLPAADLGVDKNAS